MTQHRNRSLGFYCVILTPPTKHLYLEDGVEYIIYGGIVLSNCFRKWRLLGLEKFWQQRKRNLTSSLWPRAIAGVFPHMARSLKQ